MDLATVISVPPWQPPVGVPLRVPRAMMSTMIHRQQNQKGKLHALRAKQGVSGFKISQIQAKENACRKARKHAAKNVTNAQKQNVNQLGELLIFF